MILEADERAYLRQFLTHRFNISELKNLAFDLNVDHELLIYNTIEDFPRELVLYFERTGGLGCLLQKVISLRKDDNLLRLLAKLPPCSPSEKVHIIVDQGVMQGIDTSKFRADIAYLCKVNVEQVILNAAAWSSLSLLISLPRDAVNTLVEWGRNGDGERSYRIVSIKLFDNLSQIEKNTWRFIALTSKPINAGDELQPSISWQAAMDAAKLYRIDAAGSFDYQTRSQCEITLTPTTDPSKFVSDAKLEILDAVAKLSLIPRSQIIVINLQEKQDTIKIGLRSKHLDYLISWYEQNSLAARNLGISFIVEILTEQYNLKNIRSMLNSIFSIAELRSLCYHNFRDLEDEIYSANKAEIIDKLLEFVHRKAQIPELLTLARNHNSAAYGKYGPYHNVPRRPSNNLDSRSASYRVSKWKLTMALVIGTLITSAGIIILFVAAILAVFLLELIFELVFQTTGSLSRLLDWLLWLGFIPLGIIVGKLVSEVSRPIQGYEVKRIAATSYVLGHVLLIGCCLMFTIPAFIYAPPGTFSFPLTFPPDTESIFHLISVATGAIFTYNQA